MDIFKYEKVTFTAKQKKSIGISLGILCLDALLCISYLIVMIFKMNENNYQYFVTTNYIFYFIILLSLGISVFVISKNVKTAKESAKNESLKQIEEIFKEDDENAETNDEI